MPDIIDLIRKWWKQFLGVIFLSLIAVGIITFLKPRQYLSVTTAVAASAFDADRSKIFNENIEFLYSNLGNADDLNMILGTARLDTVYLLVADKFNLFDHYKMKGDSEQQRTNAALMLKKNTRVMKSEYGELKVKVWDTDKNLAPQLANAIMDELQSIHTSLKSAANAFALKGLQDGLKKIGNDSTGQASEESKKLIRDRILQYEKLISEYQLMVDSKPPALIIVEKAKAGSRPDRPKRMQVMIATAILSFLFAFLAVLFLERRKIFRL